MVSIAIDGPSGAGKSTLSRKLAETLGFIYVDTGALYRAVALAVLRAEVNPKGGQSVAALLPNIRLELRYINGEQRVFLGEEDVSNAIRAEVVSMAASAVSAHALVRDFLLDTQRRLAREGDVIMDGRDIGTVVLPHADIKIFLTATPEDRAGRRYRELLDRGMQADYATILEDVKTRDHNDSTRAVAPLQQAADAVLLDTTGNSFDESLGELLAIIRTRLPGLTLVQ